jgi:hypothetical protein
MLASDIYAKTELGHQELGNKKLNLAHRLRCALILVDGTHAVSTVQKEARKLGAPEDFLEQLVALNLIAKIDTTVAAVEAQVDGVDEFGRFRAAKDFITASVVDALGIRSFFFTLKLEKAGTRADLKALLPDYAKAMTKAMGPDVTSVMLDRVNALLH